MKKIIYIGLAIILIFSLVACNEAVNDEEPNNAIEEPITNVEEPADDLEEDETEESLSIVDYYPFDENRIMDYEGTGNEFAEKTTMVEFIEDDKMQIKIVNPGTVFVKVLEYKNGELKEVFGEGEFYHIENMINANRNLDNTILKEPLEVGNSWTNPEGDSMEITSLDKEIETPYGKYKALEVKTEFESGAIEKNYYVKDIGFLGSIYTDGDFEVKTLLESIENKGQEIKVEAYYPSAEDIKINYTYEDVVFNTNDNIEDILEDLLKNPSTDKLVGSISDDTKINRINLDRNTWTLEVDFSEELLSDMNAGASYESEILKAIVNTLGKFYDVEKVYITVEGAPYESGHIALSEGEYFEVDTENVEKIEE